MSWINQSIRGVKELFGFKDDSQQAERKGEPSTSGPGPVPRPQQRKGKPGAHHSKKARPEPVLQDAERGITGGLQGLGWYASTLLQDQDGDLAHSFLDENLGAAPSDPPLQHKRPSDLQRTRCQVKSVQQGNITVAAVASGFS